MDTWPFGYSICVVVDPEVAYQVTVQRCLPKHEAASDVIWPLAGTKNLVSMDGPEHKRWRAIFNPGFSSAHLMTLVDGIVDDSLTFMDVLAEHAEAKDIFFAGGGGNEGNYGHYWEGGTVSGLEVSSVSWTRADEDAEIRRCMPRPRKTTSSRHSAAN